MSYYGMTNFQRTEKLRRISTKKAEGIELNRTELKFLLAEMIEQVKRLTEENTALKSKNKSIERSNIRLVDSKGKPL